MALGLVEEKDVFTNPRYSFGVIVAWEKIKHFSRVTTTWPGGAAAGGLGGGLMFEYLAWRAQNYVLKHGAGPVGGVPVFDADVEALCEIGMKAQAARPVVA